MNKRSIFFCFLSFLEGGSVMAAELLGAKMLAPYYGTSLYVWSSVLGVTLGGLAMGYFAGGMVSVKQNKERYLYCVLLASAVFLMLMPPLAKEVMLHTGGFSLLTSVFISTLIFLFPPVFCMGMVSPLIVECIASSAGTGENKQGSGKTAGTVYAISTLGGILSTFFLGFYIIPFFGLTKPAIVTGILMGVIPFFMLISKKNFFSLLLPLAVFFSLSSLKQVPENKEVKILYSSEGLLGQIIVGDYPLYGDENKVEGKQRILFVNRSTQTIVTQKEGKKGYFEYVNLISDRTRGSLPDQQALVLGLGGGSVANMLSDNKFKVEAVELDMRMAEVAQKYFELSEKVNIHIDDARHFVIGQKASDLNRKKYKVIVLDAFIGEVNPHHLFTQEFFREIRNLLADDGTFFINGNGYWNGDVGKGMRSVCKTLIYSGFNAAVVPTREEEDYRNLVFVAKKCSGDKGEVRSDSLQDISMEDAVLLIDERPQLEILNSEANRRWREGCMKYFLHSYYSRQDMLLFQ